MVARGPIASGAAHIHSTARNPACVFGILGTRWLIMSVKLEEVRSAGKKFYVPSAEICGRTVVVTGKSIRAAQVKDEEVVEGAIVEDPEVFINRLKKSELKADLFTFAQKPPATTPKYDYHW